jgi:hypothetical protein
LNREHELNKDICADEIIHDDEERGKERNASGREKEASSFNCSPVNGSMKTSI